MNSQQVNDVIVKCKANDRQAQYELYQQYSKAMYNVSLRILNDNMLAEDVLQMAFVKVFKNIHLYKNEATIGAWIKRIVINTSLSELNKKKVSYQEIEDHDFVDTIEDETSYRIEDLAAVREAIMSLPEGYRVIFSMYAIERYDHQEISEVLGISLGTSKSQYSRAKSKIKELLRTQNRISNIS